MSLEALVKDLPPFEDDHKAACSRVVCEGSGARGPPGGKA